MISATALISVVVWLVITGLIFWLLWWAVGIMNLPEPFNKIIRVILVLFIVIILVNMLLGITGKPLIVWK